MTRKIVKSLSKSWKNYRETHGAEVFVISYPKSGRTWLRVLIGKAICNRYGVDEAFMLDSFKLTQAAGLSRTGFTHDGSSNTEGRRLDELESDKSRYRNKKVILMVRDPRDVVVSCFFQATRRKKLFDGSISDFIRSDRHGIRKILRFYEIWKAGRTTPKAFLLLRYEHFHADPIGPLRSVLELIGCRDMDNETLERAVQFARFDNMKQMERGGHFGDKIMRPGRSGDEESFKVRKGKIGGYADYLNAEDRAYVDGLVSGGACPFYEDLEEPAAGL